MANIGKRVVEIVLKATDDTTGAFSGLTKKIAALTKEFPALGVLAGLGFGKIVELAGKAAQAIQQAINANVKLGASFDDMAKRTDIATETLIKWDYVAKLNDATLGDFETALRKLRQTMAEAINGGQTAIDVFNRLGVEFKNSDGSMRDLETVMLEIGQAIRRFGVESVQGAAAQDALGRSSASVVAILKQETSELEFAQREAEAYTSKMTKGWTDAAAAIDDAAERARAARENIIAGFNTNFSMSKWWDEATTGLLMQVFDIESWDKLQDLERDKAKAASKAVAQAYVAGFVGEVEAQVAGPSSQVTPLITEALRNGIAITEPVLDPSTMNIIDKQRTAEAIAADLQAALILAREMTGPGSMSGAGKMDEEAIIVPDYILPKPEQMQPFIGLTDEAAEALIALKKEALDAAKGYQDLAGEGDQTALALAEMRRVIDTLPPGLDPEVLQEIIDYYKDLRDEVESLSETQEALGNFARDVSYGLGQVGSDAIEAFFNGTQGAMKFASAVGNVVKKALADLIAQLLIVGPLMSLFGSMGIPGLARGGTIPRAANGYAVPDGPRGMDSRLIMAMPGEEVINRHLSQRLERMVSAYEYGAAVSPFAVAGGGGGGATVFQFNVARPVGVLDALSYGEAAATMSRKYREAEF